MLTALNRDLSSVFWHDYFIILVYWTITAWTFATLHIAAAMVSEEKANAIVTLLPILREIILYKSLLNRRICHFLSLKSAITRRQTHGQWWDIRTCFSYYYFQVRVFAFLNLSKWWTRRLFFSQVCDMD